VRSFKLRRLLDLRGAGQGDRVTADVHEAYNVRKRYIPESIIRPLDVTLVLIIKAAYVDLPGGEGEGIPEFESRGELDVYISAS
jgi:hypothetical protein